MHTPTRRPTAAAFRTDGYAPIGSYAALGDGRTVALVAADGCIDWWPLPSLDAPPVFAGILDPADGGHLALAPVEPASTARRYLPRTNVLETTFTTATGRVSVTDALSVGTSGRLPWSQLIRRVDGLDGTVRLRWEVQPGTRFGSARPWTESKGDTVLLHLGDQHLGLRLVDAGEPVRTDGGVHGGFTASTGSTHYLSVTSSDRAPVFVPQADEVERHLALTCERWTTWSREVRYDGPWEEAVQRSAMALKLLLHTPTGAIAAAPTTSLPERIGGPKNWDYRYMWVRDSSFTVDALISLGLHEEVQAAVTWLLGSIRRTAPHLHVFYKLDGTVAEEAATLDAPGYRGSRPVRAGNGAATQTQLGTFGDLFDTLWRYVQRGHLLDPATGRLLADLADRCCDLWATEDAGIWELPERRHYTISKMGCWVALDRAVRLHSRGEIATGHAGRWAAERDAIHQWVNQHCWSTDKRSYTFYAGSEELDAATLLAARTGFDTGERLAGTVEAVRRELARGAYVYRYSGMPDQEGAFVACTFWLVTALTVLGRLDEARALMDDAVKLTNDVGLLAEEADPDSGEQLGNFPQGLSHLALVNAAIGLQRAGTAH